MANSCGYCSIAIADGRKFCSHDCNCRFQARAVKKELPTVECAQCFKKLAVYPSTANRKKFCSRACRSVFCAANRPRFKCEKCGILFSVYGSVVTQHAMRFCSAACCGNAKKEFERRDCARCGKSFSMRRRDKCAARFCSFKCKVVFEGESRRKAEHEDQRTRLRRGAWKILRAEIIRRDGGKCTRCGSGERLHVHHIIPWRKSQDDNPSNLVTLCGACHLHVEYTEAGLPLPVRVRTLNA